MHGLANIRQDLQICLRCQLRLIQRPTSRSPRQLRSSRPVLYRQSSNFGPLPTRESLLYKKHLEFRDHEVALGVDALGEPAKIRIVRDRVAGNEEPPTQLDRSDAQNDQDYETSTSREALRRAINGDSAAVGEDVFKEYIESIKASYLATKREVGDLSSFQCAALAHQLIEGFKTDQLQTYLKASQIAQAKDHKQEPHNFDVYYKSLGSAPIRRSRWFSGKSEFPITAVARTDPKPGREVDAQVLIGDASRHQTAKQRVVERILRDIWNVRTREEKEYGELDFSIPPEVLSVLIKNCKAISRNDKLERFADVLDENVFASRARQFNVKIMISQRRSIIRLAGTYDLTSDVYKLIENSISSVKCDDLVLSQAFFKIPRSALIATLKEVENLTSTYIRLATRRDRLKVYSLGPTSDALLNVERLLSQFDGDRQPRLTQTKHESKLDPEHISSLPMVAATKLPLHERHFEWQRLRYVPPHDTVDSQHAPASGPFESRPQEGPINKTYCPRIPDLSQEHLAQLVAPKSYRLTRGFSHGTNNRKLVAVDDATAQPQYWKSEMQHQVAATLGYIVHTKWSEISALSAFQTTPKVMRAHIVKGKGAKLPVRSTLIPQVPGQSQFLEENDFGLPEVRSEFVISLKPTKLMMETQVKPDEKLNGKLQDTPDPTRLPWLRLYIAVDEAKRTTTLRLAKLICESGVLDIVLPSQASDVRFEAENSLHATENFDPAIIKFIQDSDLDPWATGQLRTPQRLHISIPKVACLELPKTVAEQLKQAGSHEVGALYSFQHLEYQSHMTMKYKAHFLQYSTVEAGKARGRRQEMKVLMNERTLCDYADTIEQMVSLRRFNSYVNTVCDLVSKIPQ